MLTRLWRGWETIKYVMQNLGVLSELRGFLFVLNCDSLSESDTCAARQCGEGLYF